VFFWEESLPAGLKGGNFPARKKSENPRNRGEFFPRVLAFPRKKFFPERGTLLGPKKNFPQIGGGERFF